MNVFSVIVCGYSQHRVYSTNKGWMWEIFEKYICSFERCLSSSLLMWFWQWAQPVRIEPIFFLLKPEHNTNRCVVHLNHVGSCTKRYDEKSIFRLTSLCSVKKTVNSVFQNSAVSLETTFSGSEWTGLWCAPDKIVGFLPQSVLLWGYRTMILWIIII